jgi:hypothetical protein
VGYGISVRFRNANAALLTGSDRGRSLDQRCQVLPQQDRHGAQLPSFASDPATGCRFVWAFCWRGRRELANASDLFDTNHIGRQGPTTRADLLVGPDHHWLRCSSFGLSGFSEPAAWERTQALRDGPETSTQCVFVSRGVPSCGMQVCNNLAGQRLAKAAERGT